MPDFTLIIPAFNEHATIAQVVFDVQNLPGCRRIIVVDDGSSDSTGDVARKAGAEVIMHSYNKGYGAALKTGIRLAETPFVICCDADGQHRREDLLKVIASMDKFDMVCGARNRSSAEWNRRLPKRVLLWVAEYLTQKKIPDLNSGLRSFRREVIRKYLHLMPDGFSFSTTSTIAMFRMGFDVHYLPIQTPQRQGRRSSVKFFQDGFKTFMLIVNLSVLFNPMRVFIPMSGFFFLLTLGYFLGYWILIRPHFTPSMVLLFITSFLLLALGVICEQVSAIRRELYNR